MIRPMGSWPGKSWSWTSQPMTATASEWSYSLAVKYRPEYPLAHYHLGALLVKQQRYREGIAEMVQSLTPDSPATPTFHASRHSSTVSMSR